MPHVEGGTLFHVSELINAVIFSNASITIIDGQNKEIIANSTDNDYNPCLPQPLYLGKRVTVTFSSNITSFGDWFPTICVNASGYSNEYMFDGAQQWTINNLIVEDYDSGYGLMRSESFHAEISCNHCSFSNITADDSLFATWGSLHFYDSEFVGITMESGNMISASLTDCTEATDSECTSSLTDREISMIDCNFTDLTLSDSFMYLYNEMTVK